MPPDGYVLHRTIASGATATVHAASADGCPVPLALKIWHLPLDGHAEERFHRELDALRALAGHPHVVQLWAGEAAPDRPAWIATELCDGSLADRLREGPVPVAEAFQLADDILAGLTAVHDSGHLHRDVKPANILLKDGRAKLCDLGITAHVSALTLHHQAGTGPYLAPELAVGQPSVRSDLYATALVLDALFAPLGLEPVRRLLARASSARPEDRPLDAPSLRHALAAQHPDRPGLTRERIAPPAAGTGPAAPGAPTRERIHPPIAGVPRRRRLLAAAAVLGLVAVLGVATGFAARRQTSTGGRPAAAVAATPSPAPSPPAAPPSSWPTEEAPPPQEVTPEEDESAPADDETPPAWLEQLSNNAEPDAEAEADEEPQTAEDDCYATAVPGGFTIPDNATIAGGPNHTSASCQAIHLKLTSATHRAYARSCLETPDGARITRCGEWVLLSYPDTWDTLATGVRAGTRWQLQMFADAPQTVEFTYTA